MSWKAKGILAYALTLPDDWTFHISELARHAKDGEDSLRTGFKELKELGYVKRYPVRDGNTKNCKVGYGNLRNATKGHATNGKPRCGKSHMRKIRNY